MSRKTSEFIADHIRNVPRSGIRDFFEIVNTRKDIISLSIGEPDFDTPLHIREAAIQSLNRGETSYTENMGILKVREAIAAYTADSFKVRYDPVKEVMITVGVSEAFDLAVRALVNPGDEVMYHEPSFVSYSPIITFAHGKPVPVITTRENGFRLTADLLEKKVTPKTRILILNFPTNPTGAVLTRSDLEGIAQFAIKHDIIVITDEIYSELTYEAERICIASLPGMKERTVFLNGFSKAWAMTGFRLGFLCAPPELTEAMMKIHQYCMMCAPTLSQKAALEALENGMSDIITMRDEYQRRRDLIVDSLNKMGLPCHKPEGAFYVFPYIGDHGIPSKKFSLQLIDEEKVACVPGTAFGSSGEGFIRCSYATNIEQIKEAMSRMTSFVNGLH